MNYNDVKICPKCNIVISKKRFRQHKEKNRCAYQHGAGVKSRRK